MMNSTGTRTSAVLGVLCAGLLSGCTATVTAHGLDREREIRPFARAVSSRHGLDRGRVEAVLSDARVLERVLAAIRRPAEAKPWKDYRPIFLVERRIEGGVEFWDRHEALLNRAEQRFGVEAGVIVAIIGVETLYGQRAGNIRVLDALATLGFRYPRRGEFFSRELESFLLLGASDGLDLLAVNGSYAGAMGIPQFIPSSYRAYAVDFDGDGRRDLIESVDDAVGSVANYLARHGWVAGGPIAVEASVSDDVAARALSDRGLKPHSTLATLRRAGVTAADAPSSETLRASLIRLDGEGGMEHWLGFENFYVITRYNRSALYAMAVHQLAQAVADRRGRR